MKVLGLDISTYCGMAYVDSANEIVGKCVHFPKLTGWPRLTALVSEVERVIDLWSPDHIFLEAYAIYRASSVVTVVSCGTVVRNMLYQKGFKWQEVPPTTLKKWGSGKGNAKKEHMALAAKERWGYESPSDDIIDAVHLCKLGQHLLSVGGDSSLKGIVAGW